MTPMVWVLLVLACGEPEVSDTDTDTGEAPVVRGLESFALPLATPALFAATQRVGVDHDPVDHGDDFAGKATCVDYLGRGFPWCYDQHRGTDFLLEGGFDTMDAGSDAVLAAAPGVVIRVVEDKYDHCHIEGTVISCDGHPIEPNVVEVEHPSGTVSLYVHLMTDSVPVEVGDAVECGDVLGMVGSSGISSTPHLHFEVHGPDGANIDPFAGPESQEATWWLDQGGDEDLPGSACPS